MINIGYKIINKYNYMSIECTCFYYQNKNLMIRLMRVLTITKMTR